MNDKEEILNILGSLIEATVDLGPAEVIDTKLHTKDQVQKTKQQADVSGTTDDPIKLYVNWIEKITQFNSDEDLKQFIPFAKAIATKLKPIAVKTGANTFNTNVPSGTDGEFYETLRWEVKDDIKYGMYNIHKMKSNDLSGQATDKVLGSVLGGVKLPTVSFGAEIKYNPEYLRNYSKLLSSLTKIIVNNNTLLAKENKENIDRYKNIKVGAMPPEHGQSTNELTIAGIKVNGQKVDLGNIDPDVIKIIRSAVAAKELPYDEKTQIVSISSDKLKPLALGWDQKTISEITDSNVSDVSNTSVNAEKGAKESFSLDDELLIEAPIGQTISRAGQEIARGTRNVAAAPSNLINDIKRLATNTSNYFKPGMYDLIGYDFGYTGRTRNSTPKLFKNKKIRSVIDVMNFIENSHVYEDKSGKVKDVLAKGADTHQFKPTKMVVFRLNNIEPTGEAKNNELIKSLPDGTLVIAAWGRIIMASEINDAAEGQKVTPRELVLTKKDRAEWYILIPHTGKSVDGDIDKVKEDIK